jgi:hypothetical protein
VTRRLGTGGIVLALGCSGATPPAPTAPGPVRPTPTASTPNAAAPATSGAAPAGGAVAPAGSIVASSSEVEYGAELARSVAAAYSAERCWASNFWQSSCYECRVEGKLATRAPDQLSWTTREKPPVRTSLQAPTGLTRYTVGFLSPQFMEMFRFEAIPGSRVLRGTPRAKADVLEVRYAIDTDNHVSGSVVVLTPHRHELRTSFRDWQPGCPPAR